VAEMRPMALPRTLEPEVMDTEQEARDYDAMDHGDVNARFCDDLLSLGVPLGRVLDVGTGPGLIPIELCGRAPAVEVDAIDLARHMLALAERNVARAGLGRRIVVSRVDAKATGRADGAYDAVVSNSIVHHIPEPAMVLREMWRLVRRGGALFVRDLERPADAGRVTELATTYAPVPAGEPQGVRAMHERQHALLAASLHAALTSDEVRAIVAPLGIPGSAVRTTSDRHWTLACVKP
jgi:2-polyprenyl-3-methyl-5-hydroxy-6-metoxy-1,4-benzoquinol methylase